MDVIGFLCVSLGTFTVQLHNNLRNRSAGSEADLVVKMANVLEELLPKSTVLLCDFVGKRPQCEGYKNVSGLRWKVFVAESGSQLGIEILSRTFESCR
jgi:hypothetical protein